MKSIFLIILAVSALAQTAQLTKIEKAALGAIVEKSQALAARQKEDAELQKTYSAQFEDFKKEICQNHFKESACDIKGDGTITPTPKPAVTPKKEEKK